MKEKTKDRLIAGIVLLGILFGAIMQAQARSWKTPARWNGLTDSTLMKLYKNGTLATSFKRTANQSYDTTYSVFADTLYTVEYRIFYSGEDSGATWAWEYYEPGASGGSAPSAATIAAAVWDEAKAGHTTANTFGKLLDTTVSSRSRHSETDVWAAGTRSLTSLTGFSLSSAGNKAIFDQAFSTAWTSGSIGDSLNNSSYMQGSASGLTASEVADSVWAELQASYSDTGTMGYLQRVTGSGGSGFGDSGFTVTIVVKDTAAAPDSILPQAVVYVTNRTQTGGQASRITNADGKAFFNLPAGNYVTWSSIAGFAHELDSFTVTAVKSDTLKLYRDAGSMTTIAFFLDRPNSTAYASAKLNFELISVHDSILHIADTLAPSNVNLNFTATANSDGAADVNLYANSLFTNDSSYYRVDIIDSRRKVILESWNFRVPVADTTVNFINIIRWQ